MSPKQKLMTTSEFAGKAGLTPAMVSKLIREGKIAATKVSGRWRIEPGQLKMVSAQIPGERAPVKMAKAAPKAEKKTGPSGKAFSVADFAAMTYLTEKGVVQWLKTGRLKGRMGPDGEYCVDAENLKRPDVSRLIRKEQ